MTRDLIKLGNSIIRDKTVFKNSDKINKKSEKKVNLDGKIYQKANDGTKADHPVATHI